MAESKSAFIDALGKLLDLDRETVVKRLSNMEVDSVLNAIDAVNRHDKEGAADLVGADDQSDDGHDEPKREIEDESEENDEPEISALFTKADKKRAKDKADRKAGKHEDAPYDPNIGDDVRIGEEEGIVKIQNGPHDTMGVTIDGEMTMVKKNEVNKLAEQMLGMTAMQDIRRMRELAGLPMSPLDTAQDTSPLEIATVEMDPDAYLAPGPVAANDESFAPAPCPATPADLSTVDDCEVEVVSEPVAPIAPVASVCMTIDGVNHALDEIEDAMMELSFRDAKCVRDRLNKMISKFNESALIRKRKV